MNKNTLLIIGGIGAAYLLFRTTQAVNTAKQLTAMIFGIKRVFSDVSSTRLMVTLRVFNPTFAPLSFQSFQFSLFYNGSKIADTTYAPGQGITLKANGNTDIDIPVTVQHFSLITNVLTLVREWLSGRFDQTIRIVGTLQAGGLTLPIDTTIKLNQVTGSSVPNTGTGILPLTFETPVKINGITKTLS